MSPWAGPRPQPLAATPAGGADPGGGGWTLRSAGPGRPKAGGARRPGGAAPQGRAGQDSAQEAAPDPRGEGFLPPVVLGREDVPGEQDQRPMTWDYTRGGHLGVAGAPRSGRSALLRLVAVGIARSASAAEVHLYGIDAGAGALLPCLSLPHCGAVVTRGESDRIRRLLALLSGEVARRQQYLASRGLASLAEQRVVAPEGERLPYLVLLIDRWDSFTAVYETTDGGAFLDQVEALMREGAAVGLRVVVTGDRRVLRGRFGMALEDRLLLRMPGPEDFEAVGMRARDVPRVMPPGRGFRAGEQAPREVQVALLEADGSGAAQAAAVHDAARWAADHWGEVPRHRRPGGVDDLPVTISAVEARRLGPALARGLVPLAVGGDTLELVQVDMVDAGNAVLVAGPRRSGRSTALLFAVQGALSTGVPVVLVLPRRSPLAALEGHRGVVGVLGPEARAEDLDRLVGGSDAPTLVVVDDYDVLGNDHALCQAMMRHMRASRDTAGGLLVGCGWMRPRGCLAG
ncbi:FtsK/SpoIIIE domain-containing protein [Actinomyces lilanjuaniae]|uniref:FtsK/SpoIIIE domain-containing protein n=1 Tax=Actinomyces lilanjuaniae TaxID=2321394 RepID=UPI001968BCB3|nr:FtsK/SpoIIIE domain-containing protein [Actinomyces lilanjuaniae]